MATITVNAQTVIDAATKTIAYIKTRQSEDDENTIIYTMSKRRLGWRGFYYPTREQAIKILNGDFFGWHSMNGMGVLVHCEKLLKLAQHGDHVVLNEKDVEALW